MMAREEQGEKSLAFASTERHFVSMVARDEEEEKKDLSECPLVLIVDDEPMNILLMKSMLEDRGIMSDIAISGSAALSLVEDRIKHVIEGKAVMYRLILLDYSMPEMDGP